MAVQHSKRSLVGAEEEPPADSAELEATPDSVGDPDPLVRVGLPACPSSESTASPGSAVSAGRGTAAQSGTTTVVGSDTSGTESLSVRGGWSGHLCCS